MSEELIEVWCYCCGRFELVCWRRSIPIYGHGDKDEMVCQRCGAVVGRAIYVAPLGAVERSSAVVASEKGEAVQ